MLCQLNGWFCWLLSGVGSIYPYCQINCFKISAKLVVPEWAWSSPMVSRNISWIGFKLSSCNWSQTEIWEYQWTYKGMKICGLELWTFYSSPSWKSFQNECICIGRVFFMSRTEGLTKYTSENYYERDQLRFFCKGLYKLYGICYKTVHAFRFCMAAKASSSKELVGLAWALHAKIFLPGLTLLIMLIWIKKSTRHRRLTY